MEIRKINFQDKCRLKTEDKKNEVKSEFNSFCPEVLVEKRKRFWIYTS